MENLLHKKIESKDILYNNLLLLGMDIQMMYKKYRIEITNTCLDQQNQKAVQLILFFLLEKLVPEEDLISLKLCFPPKNISEQNEFKTQVYNSIKSLEEKKIPKHFLVGKSIIESSHGEKIIRFLRFLSEFTLKNYLEVNFPAAKIPIIRILNPKSREHDHRDINEQYNINSFLDLKSPVLRELDSYKIREAIRSCQSLIQIQQNKFFKRSSHLFDCYQKRKEQADQITSSFLKEKDIFNQAVVKQSMLDKALDKRYLSELRALDRVPQIDMILEVSKHLEVLNTIVISKKIEVMLDEYNAKEYKNSLANILEVSNFAEKHENDGRNFILNDLLEKFMVNLQDLSQNLESSKGRSELARPIDSVIERKKRNVSSLKKMREEFSKIV